VSTRATGRLLYHDPRSRAYAAPMLGVRPTSWLHAMGPVLDQGQVNGCTGWSGADWLNSVKGRAARRRYNLTRVVKRRSDGYLDDSDGRRLYELATQADQFKWVYPPTDNGSSGLGVAKALKSLGVIDAYLWTFDYAQMLAHAQRQPVLIGTTWTDAMSDPDAEGIIHIGTERQVKAALDSGMGHEYTLRGVNWPRKLARIRNHWTADWGLKGEALIPLDELERLVIDYQGDVMVPAIGALS